MMHEIAHCLHMNHSKDFWKVRDGFVGEMRKFWGRGYTGEGVWGVGRALQNGEVEDRSVELIGIDAVEEVCGGVYRRRRRKRKVDWKEQKERRVQKKFVAPAGEGRKMGGDEDERVKLEDGKKPKGNPRVAGSKRGRELRAQAALARFETNKVKEEEVKVEEEEEDEWEEEDEPAFDTDGSILRDTNGEEMVKIREEDENDIKIKDEMREMLGLSTIPLAEERSVSTSTSTSRNDSSTSKIPAPFPQTIPQRQNPYASAPIPSDPSSTSNTTNTQPTISHTSTPILPTEATIETETTCPICTLANPSLSWICIACSHVLRPEKSSGSWTCKRPECGSGGSQYRNAADCGLCGLCGGRRSEVEGDG